MNLMTEFRSAHVRYGVLPGPNRSLRFSLRKLNVVVPSFSIEEKNMVKKFSSDLTCFDMDRKFELTNYITILAIKIFRVAS